MNFTTTLCRETASYSFLPLRPQISKRVFHSMNKSNQNIRLYSTYPSRPYQLGIVRLFLIDRVELTFLIRRIQFSFTSSRYGIHKWDRGAKRKIRKWKYRVHILAVSWPTRLPNDLYEISYLLLPYYPSPWNLTTWLIICVVPLSNSILQCIDSLRIILPTMTHPAGYCFRRDS